MSHARNGQIPPTENAEEGTAPAPAGQVWLALIPVARRKSQHVFVFLAKALSDQSDAVTPAFATRKVHNPFRPSSEPSPVRKRASTDALAWTAWRYEPKLDGFRGLLWRFDSRT